MHDGVDEDAGRTGEGEGDYDERKDKKSSLFAGFLRRPRNAEGVDEGVGEEVEELHGSYYALQARHLHCGCIAGAADESNERRACSVQSLGLD